MVYWDEVGSQKQFEVIYFSEPPVTTRTDSDKEKDDDDSGQADNEVTELIVNAEGDKDVDDKTSRPRSGEVQITSHAYN